MASQLLLFGTLAALATFTLAAPGDSNETLSNSITEPVSGSNPTRQIHPLSKQYLGQWQLISSENFDKYMEAVGVNPLARTFGNAAKPLLDIKLEDGRFKVMTEIHGFRTVTYDFVLNKEFDEVTPDGRFMKSVFRLRRDGKLIQFQKKISPHDKDSKFTRYIEGDKLIVLCEAEGVTAKRVYQKVPEGPPTLPPPPAFAFPIVTAAPLPTGLPVFTPGTLPTGLPTLPTGLPLFTLGPLPTGFPLVSPAAPLAPSSVPGASSPPARPAAPDVAPFSA